MQEREFDKLRSIVEKETGIALRDDKRELLANRLSKRLRALGLKTAGEYLEILETEAEPEELLRFIDAVSTNVTHFFREPDHFDVLRAQLEALRSESEVKIWCAAAATGEEPYTLAMIACDVLPDAERRCRILATDISIRALQRAIEGAYGARQMANVPKLMLQRHFIRERGDAEDVYRASPQLKSMITFRRLNLSRFPYRPHGPIDAIFCRNVMIYFDVPLRAKMIQNFQQLLRMGGYLYIGHSENLLGIEHALKVVKASVFRRVR